MCTLDPRIDGQALRLALRFENACNIFLRRASRNYLDILTDEGLLDPPIVIKGAKGAGGMAGMKGPGGMKGMK